MEETNFVYHSVSLNMEGPPLQALTRQRSQDVCSIYSNVLPRGERDQSITNAIYRSLAIRKVESRNFCEIRRKEPIAEESVVEYCVWQVYIL